MQQIDLGERVFKFPDTRRQTLLQVDDRFPDLHSRTKFEDWPEPERRRHLIRLWMRVEEGKRPLIPELAKEIERGVFLEGVELNAALEP